LRVQQLTKFLLHAFGFVISSRTSRPNVQLVNPYDKLTKPINRLINLYDLFQPSRLFDVKLYFVSFWMVHLHA
jgi:hypothetical protein